MKLKAFIQEHIPILVLVKRLIWKFSRLPYLLMAIPCVVLLRVIKIWKVFRFGQLAANNFGHFWTPEFYLCERDLGWQEKKRIIDIFYTVAPAINQTLLKKWQKHIRLFPQNKLLKMIDIVNRWIPGYEDHVITLKSQSVEYSSTPEINKKLLSRKPVAFNFYQDIGVELLAKTSPHIAFTAEEERLGKKALKEMGIGDSAQYICFHARDGAYKKAINPAKAWSYHDFRDADIKNYIPMAERFVRLGFYMVRMGVKVEKALDTLNPMIIDYALKYRTEFLDLYIGANCRFFITSLTGVNIIPTLFRKPTVLVNVIPYDILYAWTPYDLFILKKLWLKKEKRFLTFREIMQSDIQHYSFSELYGHNGIEVIENTSDEITTVALEINERLNGTWKTTQDDERLQQRFWHLFKKKRSCEGNLLRLGRDFLRENKELLE